MTGIWAPDVTISHVPPQCLSSRRFMKSSPKHLSSSFLTTLVDVELVVMVHLCHQKRRYLEELSATPIQSLLAN
ncbi:hypothetical protein M9458_055840, partial [Cirrhinus mrigala]